MSMAPSYRGSPREASRLVRMGLDHHLVDPHDKAVRAAGQHARVARSAGVVRKRTPDPDEIKDEAAVGRRIGAHPRS
ncbi:hypothetical protein [Sorangium sp. So ce176]|uniref:hypothetical protein n=1 Tax=Sorangium sp. So ce176 TaxID=3133286 RepID=UPI003F5EBD9A